jgi:hypothetical protein
MDVADSDERVLDIRGNGDRSIPMKDVVVWEWDYSPDWYNLTPSETGSGREVVTQGQVET